MTPIRLRLRETRKARGWSQAQLATAAGVRQATISKLETGPIRRLDLEILDKLAVALEVHPGYLILRVPSSDE